MYHFIDFETLAMSALYELIWTGTDEVSFSTIVRYSEAIIKKFSESNPDVNVIALIDRRYQIDFVENNSDLIDVDFSMSDVVFKLKRSDCKVIRKLKEALYTLPSELFWAFRSNEARETLGVVSEPHPNIKIEYIYAETSDLVKNMPTLDSRILFNYMLHRERIDPDKMDGLSGMMKINNIQRQMHYTVYYQIHKNHVYPGYTMDIRFYFPKYSIRSNPYMEKDFHISIPANFDLSDSGPRENEVVGMLQWLERNCLLRDGYIDQDFHNVLYDWIVRAYEREKGQEKPRFDVKPIGRIFYEVVDKKTDTRYEVLLENGREIYVHQIGVFDPSDSVGKYTEAMVFEAVERYRKDH